MIDKNLKGSVWRKWDLHIHSNASDGKGTSNEIIDKALEQELSVIALTDHHTVKGIDEAKRYGKEKGITVISGIEFRTEYGHKSVHMIGLFPDSSNGIVLDQKALYELVLNPLRLSETAIVNKGKEEKPDADDEEAFKIGMFMLQVDFKEAANIIHKYGGLVSVHAGNKTNSIEEMKHAGNSPKNVDSIEDSLGTVKKELMGRYIDICDIQKSSEARFYLEQWDKPSIATSDAHSVEEIGCKFTWIKADPTFEGLRQIIYEPNERVCIQEHMPEAKSDYQLIDYVTIQHDDFGKQRIPFNPNLNAIIGGRSSGKSILLGSIAKMANFQGEIKAENQRYNEYIESLISGMELVWKDGGAEQNRKVEYFPQSYINSLASNSGEVINLIEEILKGDDTKRLKFEDNNDDISENKIKIANEIEMFFKLQYKINEIDEKVDNIGNKDGLEKEIGKIEIEIDKIKKKGFSGITESEEKDYTMKNERKAELESVININEGIIKKLSKLESMLITKEIDTELIEFPKDLQLGLKQKFDDISSEANLRWKNIIIDEKQSQKEKNIIATEEIEKINTSEDYLKCQNYYEENKAYMELSNRLKNEKEKLNMIDDFIQKRGVLVESLGGSKKKIIDLQRKYMGIGKRLCKEISLDRDDVKIIPYISFKQSEYTNLMESRLHKRGNDNSKIISYIYDEEDEFYTMLGEIFDALAENRLTLKGGGDSKQLILDLFSNNYFEMQYEVEYQGDTLSSMSEGKKAFVILRMLLDFSENKCPILIDQPEDDLDNRAIYTELVTYLRKKKKERQIILVTHNPNVVVGADSEQIIVANQHGIQNENQDNIKFEYLSGALEDVGNTDKSLSILLGQGIRSHVCDILEGGDIAFMKRERKYQLNV